MSVSLALHLRHVVVEEYVLTDLSEIPTRVMLFLGRVGPFDAGYVSMHRGVFHAAIWPAPSSTFSVAWRMDGDMEPSFVTYDEKGTTAWCLRTATLFARARPAVPPQPRANSLLAWKRNTLPMTPNSHAR